MSDTLPAGWESLALEEVMEIHDRLRVPLNARQRAARPGPFPYYGANGQAGTLDDYIFDGEYLLVAEDGGHFLEPSRGVAYRVSGQFWVNNHAHVLRPRDGMPVMFFVHQLNSLDWRPHVSGTTRLKLTQGAMKKMPLLVPPLPEQRRIVARIESLQARSRRAKEALDAIPPLLERFRQSVLAAAFRGDLTADWRRKNPDVEPASVLLERIRAERKRRWIDAEAEKARGKAEAKAQKAGKPWAEADDRKALEAGRKRAEKRYKEPEPVDPEGLPELPEGWCWTNLDGLAVGNVDYRGRTPPKSPTGEIPLISSAAVKHDRIKVGPSGFIEASTYRALLTRGLPLPDDLVVTTEAPVGEAALFPADQTYMLSRRVIAFRFFAVSPRFVMHALYGDAARRHLGIWGRGTTVPRILKPKLLATPVPLAPALEQAEAVRRVDSALGSMWALRPGAQRAQEELLRLDGSVLAKAFRGEL